MRHIQTVVRAIKRQVPKDFDLRDAFFKELFDLLESAKYRAPEAYSVNFEQLAMILDDYLGIPDVEWKKTIADIFADKIKIEE